MQKALETIALTSPQTGFLDKKLAHAIELLGGELPPCCQTHLHALPEKTA